MNTTFKHVFLAILTMSFLASCGMQKMADQINDVKFKVQPNPLENKGGKVGSKLLINFPAKYFNKKAIVTVTPVIKAGNSELELDKFVLKGESVTTNADAQVIENATGGNVEQVLAFDYSAEYASSEVLARISGSDGKKTYPFPDQNLAVGIINSIELLSKDEQGLLAFPLLKGVESIEDRSAKTSSDITDGELSQDLFGLRVPKKVDVKVFFQKNRSFLRNSQKQSKEVANFKKNVKGLAGENMSFSGAKIIGSASPEGPLDLNSNLSNKRADATIGFYRSYLKSAGVGNVGDESFFSVSDLQEDWAGFEKLVTASELENKDLILSILSNYQDLEEREVELKKLTKVFLRLESDILPVLRNSRLELEYIPHARTDEEILALAITEPSVLNSEELLYASMKVEDLNEKIAITEKFIELYPEDWRGYNNLGNYSLTKGDMVRATDNLTKAETLTSNNGIVSVNLGVLYRWGNDIEKTKEYHAAATSAGENGEELKYNKGVVSMIEGNYEEAKTNFAGAKTLNSVLLEILNRDFETANQVISELPEKLSSYPMGKYLSAIVFFNYEQDEQGTKLLTELEKEDTELFNRSKTDLEFPQNR